MRYMLAYTCDLFLRVNVVNPICLMYHKFFPHPNRPQRHPEGFSTPSFGLPRQQTDLGVQPWTPAKPAATPPECEDCTPDKGK